MINKRETPFQAPYVLAMLICDAVHRDPGTGKPTIIGCFGTIGAAQFPAAHPFMTVYVELTDGRGQVPLTLRLVDSDEDSEIFRAETEVNMSDPLAIVVTAFGINGAIFPKAGEYRMQLLAGTERLLERRLLLLQLPGGPANEQQSSDG